MEKLFIGFESGNNEDLRLYNKHCTVDEQEKIPNFINIVCMQERLKHLGMKFHEDAYELLRSYQKNACTLV